MQSLISVWFTQSTMEFKDKYLERSAFDMVLWSYMKFTPPGVADEVADPPLRK